MLRAGQEQGASVTGLDLNPYATLLSMVKLQGFDGRSAAELSRTLLERARRSRRTLPIAWDLKDYWFAASNLEKYERIRYQAAFEDLVSTPEGRAVLLAIALSVRLCSKADQRSPKPFISKTARLRKIWPNPYEEIERLLYELTKRYGMSRSLRGEAFVVDVVRENDLVDRFGSYSHIITSPPYLNAQDYFRNFKLELYVLEGVLGFCVDDLKPRFIGTERGLGKGILLDKDSEERRLLVPELRMLEKVKPKLARVVHAYLRDMRIAFSALSRCLQSSGTLVVVCGDNLVGGVHVRTWEVLNNMLESLGFKRFESYGDKILCRAVPPARKGHKGLIKEEIISAFCLGGNSHKFQVEKRAST
jgi:hypothetical protein